MATLILHLYAPWGEILGLCVLGSKHEWYRVHCKVGILYAKLYGN